MGWRVPGVRSSWRRQVARRAKAQLVRLAERLGAPLVNTLYERTLFADAEHQLGVFGISPLREPEWPSTSAIVHRLRMRPDPTDDRRWLAHEGQGCGPRRHRLGEHRSSCTADFRVLGDASTVAGDLVQLLDALDHEPTGFGDKNATP